MTKPRFDSVSCPLSEMPQRNLTQKARAEECTCTNEVHGGKLWKCGTPECEHYVEPDHPNTCRCEVCRFWS